METLFAAIRLVPYRISAPREDDLIVDERTVSTTADAAQAKSDRDNAMIPEYARDWPVVGVAEVHVTLPPAERERILAAMHRKVAA